MYVDNISACVQAFCKHELMHVTQMFLSKSNRPCHDKRSNSFSCNYYNNHYYNLESH